MKYKIKEFSFFFVFLIYADLKSK